MKEGRKVNKTRDVREDKYMRREEEKKEGKRGKERRKEGGRKRGEEKRKKKEFLSSPARVTVRKSDDKGRAEDRNQGWDQNSGGTLLRRIDNG